MINRDDVAVDVVVALIRNLAYGAELRRIFDPSDVVANQGDDKETPITYTARLAYAFADAMMTERYKKELVESHNKVVEFRT